MGFGHNNWRTTAIASLWTAALLGTLLGAPARAARAPRVEPLAERRPVCIRGICFDAEVAVTATERGKGLMYRDFLAKDRGMLFVFPKEGRHRFWMKNTLIELDIIFIDADLSVVGVTHRAPPCREKPCEEYGPDANAGYALEIAGGLAATYGFAAGDLVEIREAAPGR